MGFKEDLEKRRPESVRMLEALKFEWVQQGPSGEPWSGYKFVRQDGQVDKFSYFQLVDNDVGWLKSQLIALGFAPT